MVDWLRLRDERLQVALLSLKLSTSPQPDPVSGTWFQNLQGCPGDEESQGEGESHVLSSDPVPDYVQQVQYLQTRKKGRKKKRICRTSVISLILYSLNHGFAEWPAPRTPGTTQADACPHHLRAQLLRLCVSWVTAAVTPEFNRN